MPVEQGDARQGTGLAGQIAQCLYDITRGQFDVRVGYELIDAIACALAPAINENAGGGAEQDWAQTLALDNGSDGNDPNLTSGDIFKYGGLKTSGDTVSEANSEPVGAWDTTIQSTGIALTGGVPVDWRIAEWSETGLADKKALVNVNVAYQYEAASQNILATWTVRALVSGTSGSYLRVLLMDGGPGGTWSFHVASDVLYLRFTPTSGATSVNFSGKASVVTGMGYIFT